MTIGPEPVAKLRQALFFESPEWSTRYHTLRSTIEGMNGFLKDGARGALDDPERRRVRGVAAQSVFVALLVFAGNLRKIEEFLKLAVLNRPARTTTAPTAWQVPYRLGSPRGRRERTNPTSATS
jgi:hypothetical protein